MERKPPTWEEQKLINKQMRDISTARKAITEHTGGQRRVSGSIDCPVCEGGKLGYSVAFNGHVHARCSTVGCVSWME